MTSNWSLILNILLLAGVVFAIARLMQSRREEELPVMARHGGAEPQRPVAADDIIAVRRITPEFNMHVTEVPEEPSPQLSPRLMSEPEQRVSEKPATRAAAPSQPTTRKASAPSVMIFLLAKEGHTLAGYELLQTLLASGLRFGEGQIFHRHQFSNGQGPVMCSLAAATESGTFDLQNIGAFSVRGLCLFMQSSGNAAIDAERFKMMLDTAHQLSEGLDAHLLDDQQKPLSQASVVRYQQMLHLDDCVEERAWA